MQKLTLPISPWEGFSPTHTELHHDTLTIHLTPSGPGQCRCGQAVSRVHDVTIRTIQERDVFGYQTLLSVPLRRLRCPDCGVVTECLSWLEPHARQTNRLILYVEQLLKRMPIKHVNEMTGLHWHTLKRLDIQRLTREVTEPDWSKVRRLVMDEFALFKGHRYATVIADADTHQVLWVGEGRSREAIRPFFLTLGEHCQHIEAVAMDMNTAFDLEVAMHCPNAAVVYDLFHVVAKYGREVVDRVRVDRANELRQDKPARRRVKRGRWVLLKNRKNMTDKQHAYLEELLAENRSLMVVYLMREQLKELWYADSPDAALSQWRLWWQQVTESGIEPLIRFAKKLKPYLNGIIASATFRLHTCKLEGMNNKIKVIKRMAYGYRDSDYFFLKIRAAFPGNAR
ncbi:ISL3 family transposase [Ferrimonas sp. YFM]|uniref:ISL3 family transposase n=1 Tax=Ferrimonas sp. YFM TaxID=3028878 RepID=UPI002572B504|nr:ISL3 family transposase [Ferrimonas sp. YFM]BDY03809.1 ISL3 family transposase [Ferrimonas sp. YFM]